MKWNFNDVLMKWKFNDVIIFDKSFLNEIRSEQVGGAISMLF